MAGETGSTDADVLIKIASMYDSKGMQRAVKSMQSFSGMVRQSFAQGTNSADHMTEAIVQTQQNSQKLFDSIYGSANRVVPKIDKMNKSLGNARGAMLGLGLSVMFMGMAMKRLFDSIWKSSTKVFQEVMHSVEGTVTGFDRLTNSLAFLKFTMGEALSPIADLLIPIVMRIADWVEQNPKIAAGLVIVLGVLGTLMTILGQVFLFVWALTQAWPFMATAAKGAWLAISKVALAIWPWIVAAAKAAWVAIASVGGATIGLIILAIIALVIAWKTNFAGIREFVIETFKIIWVTIKSIFKDIVGIFKGLIKIVKGIFTGDIDEVLSGLIDVFFNALSAVIKLFLGLGAAVWNVFIFIKNVIIDLLLNPIIMSQEALLKTINMLNKVKGVNIPTSGIEKLIEATKQLKEGARGSLDYMTGDQVAEEMGALDQLKEIATEWANRQLETGEAAAPITNVTVDVNLDGEQIANNTSQRILTGVEETQ